MGRPKLKIEQRIQLKTKDPHDTLNGYFFVDEGHATKWLSQPFVNDEDYAVAEVRVKVSIAPCCGQRRYGPILESHTMKVSEFLQQQNDRRTHAKG